MATEKILSRHRLLAQLRRSQTATAAELAEALKVTPADVRHHLSILLSEGRVRVAGSRHGKGRGRPVQLFALSLSAMGDNLGVLAAAALDDRLAGKSPDGADRALRSLARALGVPAASEGPLVRRMAAAIERLNAMNYHARWEAHASGPRVTLGHCPYYQIIDRHPGLCVMDRHLLEGLTGIELAQLAKLEPGPRGLPVCIFASSHA